VNLLYREADGRLTMWSEFVLTEFNEEGRGIVLDETLAPREMLAKLSEHDKIRLHIAAVMDDCALKAHQQRMLEWMETHGRGKRSKEI